jgi:hypothetical protein
MRPGRIEQIALTTFAIAACFMFSLAGCAALLHPYSHSTSSKTLSAGTRNWTVILDLRSFSLPSAGIKTRFAGHIQGSRIGFM